MEREAAQPQAESLALDKKGHPMGGFFPVADYQLALGDSRRPRAPSASRLHHIGGKRCYLAFTQLRAVCGHSTDSLGNRALYLLSLIHI